jgi:hypothetical protein
MRHAVPVMVLLGAAFTVTGVARLGGMSGDAPDASAARPAERARPTVDSIELTLPTRWDSRHSAAWYDASSPEAYNERIFCEPHPADRNAPSERPVMADPSSRPCASYPGPWAPSVEDDSALYSLPYPVLHRPLKPE